MTTRRRVLGALASLAVLSACSVSITNNPLLDDRSYREARPRGPIAMVGDSVGYGVTAYGGLAARLADAGWGPVRTRAVVGLHAAPESATDTNTAVHRIGEIRAEGVQPSVVVAVVGHNDVGYPGGRDVAANVRRIETALAAFGDLPVVWTTINHNDRGLMDAWNAALRDVAARHPRVVLCDWAALAQQQPALLERDGVHATVGSGGGYAALASLVAGCVDTVAPAPAAG